VTRLRWTRRHGDFDRAWTEMRRRPPRKKAPHRGRRRRRFHDLRNELRALNNAGAMRKNLIVVLNDNTMSISAHPLRRALADYLSSCGWRRYTNDIKAEGARNTRSRPRRRTAAGEGPRTTAQINPGDHRRLPVRGARFTYYGPVDGHNIAALIDALKGVKRLSVRPFSHILTTRARPRRALEDPFRMHGVAPSPKHVEFASGQTQW